MGQNGGATIRRLFPCFELSDGSNVHISPPILIDPKFFQDHDLSLQVRQNFSDMFSCEPEYYSDLQTALPYIANSLKSDPELKVIIYDAGPTSLHESQLAILGPYWKDAARIFYFGEKPLFVDPHSLEKYGKEDAEYANRVFCDFIETQNPAVLALQDHIQQNNRQIKRMHFWRAGATGIKHTAQHKQQGVQGGALLDKSLHDVSIALVLLAHRTINKFRISKAEITRFIPNFNEKGELLYLDSKGDWSHQLSFDLRKRLGLAADGQFEGSIVLEFEDATEVSIDFLFGWLGVATALAEQHLVTPAEKDFVEQIRGFGLEIHEWLSMERAHDTLQFCMETQARVGLIDCGSAQYLINMYMSEDEQIKRRVIVRDNNGLCEIPVRSNGAYAEQKILDLSGMFKSVIGDATTHSQKSAGGWRNVRIAHEIILQMREKAIADAKHAHPLRTLQVVEHFRNPERWQLRSTSEA
jgi:predicted dehydrogenase